MPELTDYPLGMVALPSGSGCRGRIANWTRAADHENLFPVNFRRRDK